MSDFLPCLMFVPPIVDRYWTKLQEVAPRLGGVVLDLEDAVHDKFKDNARQKILQQCGNIRLLTQAYQHLRVFIRVNNMSTPHYSEDMKMLAQLLKEGVKVDGVMYPKVRDEQVYRLDDDLRTHGGDLPVFVLIEDMEGYLKHHAILAACPQRVTMCAVGAEDLCVDLAIDRPLVLYDNLLLQQVMVNVALTCHAKRIQFWGNISPYRPSCELVSYFIRECIIDTAIGACGKLAFHPSQIEIINRVFNSDLLQAIRLESLIDSAKLILQRSEEGLAVALHNGRMVDTPVFVALKRWLNVAPKSHQKWGIVHELVSQFYQ